MSLIRQVFGTTHPKDIWRALIGFEAIAPKPVVHITYWMGLGIFLIFTSALTGGVVSSALREAFPMGLFLGFPLLLLGLLGMLIGAFVWRGFCEFFLAVLTIAEDLKYIRQAQERFEAETMALQAQNAEAAASMRAHDITSDPIPDDPFFQSRITPESSPKSGD